MIHEKSFDNSDDDDKDNDVVMLLLLVVGDCGSNHGSDGLIFLKKPLHLLPHFLFISAQATGKPGQKQVWRKGSI